MADNNKTLMSLIELGVTKSTCSNITLKASNIGKPLAKKGACKAVILRLNNFVNNSETELDAPYFYHGDRNSQLIEVRRGENSQIIFCSDLSEVYVKYPVLVDRDTNITIRVLIYN